MAEGAILLTGSAGFVAPYLAPRLADAFPGRQMVKVLRTGPAAAGERVVDLADPEASDALVASVRPGIVVHLAAHSSVAKAAQAPSEVWRNNRDGTFWLARAIARHAPQALVFMASTAEVYGRNLVLGPADELTPLAPRGPYALSKRASEYVLEHMLPASARLIIARAFNHTGPGQAETFVVASFAAQLARIEAGLAPPTIRVGNLEPKRDFLDVRDVAEAYVGLLKGADRLEPHTVVNVARGEAVSIREILDMLCSLARVKVVVEVDERRVRPNEVPVATAVSRKLASFLPWPPRRPLIDTLRDVLEDQRARIARSMLTEASPR